jgi:hypothetical protein
MNRIGGSYTLLLSGRSHVLSDAAAAILLRALEADEATATVVIELNGEGSGGWEVTINVRQIIALIKHPRADATPTLAARLRSVPDLN